jgi:hypothetical protein
VVDDSKLFSIAISNRKLKDIVEILAELETTSVQELFPDVSSIAVGIRKGAHTLSVHKYSVLFAVCEPRM